MPRCEATTIAGHLIILGLFEEIPEGLHPERAIELARDLNAVVIAVHPYDLKFGLGDQVMELDVDALETNGKRNSKQNKLALKTGKLLNLSTVGGSDAHKVDQIGNCVNSFNKQFSNWKEIINEIKNGQVKRKIYR